MHGRWKGSLASLVLGAGLALSFARGLGEDAEFFGCPLFGGDRSLTPHPTHACPGFEMGFGILLGIVYGVV